MGLWRRRTQTAKRPHTALLRSSLPRPPERRRGSAWCSPGPHAVATRRTGRANVGLPAVHEDRQGTLSRAGPGTSCMPQKLKAMHIPRLAFVALLGVIGLGSNAAAASADDAGMFANTPAAAPSGSSITVSSITPCPPLPPEAQGPPLVYVVLTQGRVDARVVGSVELPVNASGTWSGTLVVGASASQDDATLDAICFPSAQTGEAELVYRPHTFAVTAAPAPVPPRPVATAPRLAG